MPSPKQIQEENAKRAYEFFEKNPELKLDSDKLFEPSQLRQELQSFGRTKRFQDIGVIVSSNPDHLDCLGFGLPSISCFSSPINTIQKPQEFISKIYLPINVIDHSKFEKPNEDFYITKFPLKGKDE